MSLTKAEIERQEKERAEAVRRETERLLNEDRGRRLAEADEEAFREFRASHPDVSRQDWERLTPTHRTSQQAFKEELTAARRPDGMDRSNEERRRLELEQRINARAKAEAEEEARRKAAEEQLELELQPEKARIRRQWLADHPGKTPAEFDRFAWPNLRQNVIEAREERLRREQREKLAASGSYQM